MPTCADLIASHDDLKGHLKGHMEATVLGDLEAARAHFLDFAALLFGHSLGEDEILIPAFASAGLETLGCTVEILSKEHEKLRRLVQEAADRILAPDVVLDAPTRIAWITSLHMLREVLSHHDERERAAFHPVFDEAMTAEESAELAQHVSEVEALRAKEWRARQTLPS